jgi:PAS domain S-box-containing protein
MPALPVENFMRSLCGRRRDLVLRRARGQETAVRELSTDEFAAITAAARAVNDADDESQTLHEILDQAIRLLAADEGSVILYEPDRRSLRIRVSRGLHPEIAEQVEIIPGRGIAGTVAQTGRPLLLASDDDVEGFDRDYEKARPLRSAVCIPLWAAGIVEGVLTVNVAATSTDHPGFDDHDLALVTVFAEQAAAAIRAQRLIRESRSQRERLRDLFELGYALTASLRPEEIARVLLLGAGQLAGATAGFVALESPDGSTLQVVAHHNLNLGRAVATARSAELSASVTEGRRRLVERIDAEPALSPLAMEHGDCPAVILPLVKEGRTLGVLVTVHRHDGPDDAMIDLLDTLASHACLAFANAVLVRDLEEKKAQLSRFVHAVPDPVIVADGSGRFVAVNPAAAERFGLDSRFLAGTPLAGQLRCEELESLLFSDHATVAELTVHVPQPRTYRVRVSLVHPELGAASTRVAALEDITTEVEMRQLKSDFVSVIGHELRTPLTLIKGYAATLANREGRVTTELRERAIASLYAHTLRLERLVEDLLLVSRIERGRPALELSDSDVVSLLRESVAAARREHPGRDIRFVTEVGELTMPLDTVKVEQIMHHLLENALKFSEAGDPVVVRLEAGEDTVSVSVVDQGIGIYSGDLPNLFERFRQIDGSETRRHGGTGVGLYICKTLAEAHGGQVFVRSALGKGSTFTLSLPRNGPSLATVGQAETSVGSAS